MKKIYLLFLVLVGVLLVGCDTEDKTVRVSLNTPTKCKAKAMSSTKILLTWSGGGYSTRNYHGSKYRYYRICKYTSPNSNSYKEYTVEAATTTFDYVIDGLSPNHTYSFTIEYCMGDYESDKAQCSGTTKLSPPRIKEIRKSSSTTFDIVLYEKAYCEIFYMESGGYIPDPYEIDNYYGFTYGCLTDLSNYTYAGSADDSLITFSVPYSNAIVNYIIAVRTSYQGEISYRCF